MWYDITSGLENKVTDDGGIYEEIRFKSTDVWIL